MPDQIEADKIETLEEMPTDALIDLLEQIDDILDKREVGCQVQDFGPVFFSCNVYQRSLPRMIQ